MFYPYSNQLQTAAKSFDKGNFSLWFNKLIPLNNERNCRPCNKQGKDKEAVQYYESFYKKLKSNPLLANLLAGKQKRQKGFCELYEKAGYQIICYHAVLKSPLIAGIGQTHPNEVGMVFDHTMGVPYIPASSVKGIVRFAHMLELIKSENLQVFLNKEKDGIIESIPETKIPDLFGSDADIIKNGKKKTETWKGKVIFLDAYPDRIPELHVDIMNPHYGEYYSSEKGETPPADYLDPNPIKFLTVKPGTVFIFRALLAKDSGFLLKPAKTAFEHAFNWLGFGAKTAVGYGAMQLDPAVIEVRRRKAEQRAKEEEKRRRREAEEKAERLRREAEAAEARRKQAEFDALPEHEKALRRAREDLARFPESGPLKKDKYGEFTGIINKLTGNAESWPGDIQAQIADFIEQQCERLGWYSSGQRKNKRKKREQKWRDLIDKLRNK